MKRNRRVTKRMSRVAKTSMRFGAIVVSFVVMVIMNLLSASSCTQLLKQKGALERELARLEDARTREASRWEEMKTPEGIERALTGSCLPMKLPHPNQIVVMQSNGLPRPGQASVSQAQARARRQGVTVKLNTSVRAPYRRRVRR